MDREDLQIISVGLGELRISRDGRACLVAHGLGSCVGVCVYDPLVRVAAMLHAMLPENANHGPAQATKFVDTGIRQLLDEMASQGALRSRLVVRIAGGAHMLTAPGFKNTLNIGARNVEMALATLQREGLRLAAQDTGGHFGRTVRLYVSSGSVTVRSVGKGEQETTL